MTAPTTLAEVDALVLKALKYAVARLCRIDGGDSKAGAATRPSSRTARSGRASTARSRGPPTRGSGSSSSSG